MNLDEYAGYDALGLAELVRRGEVKPRELCELAIAAIRKVNPEINAVLDVYEDVLERVDREPPRGRFAGVPFALKDIGCCEKGRPYECGSRLLKGNVAEYDTDLFVRFRKAGLVNLGRTACPEYGSAMTTESILNGATCNPWNPEHIAGGSSGGAGAIVAAGALPIAHANDGAGSTRIPASCNGLVGLKASRGRVPQGPAISELIGFLYSEHVVSRSVRDTAALLDEVHGPAVGEAFEIAPPERPYLDELGRPATPLRIGLCAGAWGRWRPTPDVAAGVEATAKLCESLGHRVTEVEAPLDVEALLLAGLKPIWMALVASDVDYWAQTLGRPIDDTTVEPVILAVYEYGMRLGAADWLRGISLMSDASRSLGAFFGDYDLLLTPTLAEPPARLGSYDMDRPGVDIDEYMEKSFGAIPYTPIANCTGVPAISLPLWQSKEGLPVGMHFMAPFGQEGRLLGLAGSLEDANPWIERRPGIHVAR